MFGCLDAIRLRLCERQGGGERARGIGCLATDADATTPV